MQQPSPEVKPRRTAPIGPFLLRQTLVGMHHQCQPVAGKPEAIHCKNYIQPCAFEMQSAVCSRHTPLDSLPHIENESLSSPFYPGEPKAIPWSHTTPLRCATDAWSALDVGRGDIAAWPTNLGWMMGPWLLYAALLNGATIALFHESRLDTCLLLTSRSPLPPALPFPNTSLHACNRQPPPT